MTTTTPDLGDLVDESDAFIAPVVDQSRPPEIECLCPFCGAFNTGVGKPCLHCALEDNNATRLATTVRLGPWFVLETGNPSAPGMNFEGLQSLIRRHVVTSRSVVRGPTTGQLWRLASKVRGLSREFGQCYDCGEDIDRDETVCPHCERLQTLPDTSEARGEITEPGASVTARTEPAVPEPIISQPIDCNPVEITEAAATTAGEPASTEDEPTTAVASPQAVTNTPEPEPITVMSSDSDEGPPRELLDADYSADRHIPRDDLLTARDVAKAFLLEFGPTVVAAPREIAPRRYHFDYRKLKTGLSLVAVLMLAALIWPVGRMMVGWFQSTPAAVTLSETPAAPTDTTAADARPARDVQTPQPAPALVVKPVSPISKPAEATAVAPPVVVAAKAPDPQPIVQPVIYKSNAPAVEPASPPSPSDDPKVLWNVGMEAESRGDYKSAVDAYEHLESLPSDSWPKNLEVRLMLARKELKGDVR